MRTLFIALATICRFFTQDIWEKKPARNSKAGKKLVKERFLRMTQNHNILVLKDDCGNHNFALQEHRPT